jgi:hypothetical protein
VKQGFGLLAGAVALLLFGWIADDYRHLKMKNADDHLIVGVHFAQ